MTCLTVLATSGLIIGCTVGNLYEERERRLMRLDERVVNGIGMMLYTPQPIALGPQPIVVSLTVGSRNEMANLSAVWLTYQLPHSGLRSTVRMVSVNDYIDAFGARVPFTEPGLWQLTVQVYRVGGVPAISTFTIVCCGESVSQ